MKLFYHPWVLVTIIALTAVSCKKAPEEIAVQSISLNKSSEELVIGESVLLNAIVTPSNATQKTITWLSSNQAVATVAGGKVTAVAEGTATITATADGKWATCAITVKKKTVYVASVELNKIELDLIEDESESLVATVKPDDATDKTVTWTSSNESIATVVNGKVMAVKEGKATITAKAGEKEATCKVTVAKRIYEVESVTLNKQELSLTKGESETLVAIITPDNATDKTVTWSTSNAEVATVENGKVTAIKSGTAAITAKAGEKSATCSVTVKTPVESITLDKTTVSIEEGQSTTIVASVNPSDADEKTVSWSSSNPAAAIVEKGLVAAIGEGEATITATAGGKSATCKVTVRKKVIPVTSLTLNKTNLELTKGQSESLTATVKPDDATDKTVTWSTSDASIATVDQNGKVTAVDGGTATIKAVCGEKSAECKVTVTVPVESITLDKTSIELKKSETVNLVATINPGNATDKTVTWSTSDASIATVDQNGKVTAVKSGTAIITAKAGSKSAACSVSVTTPVTGISLDRTSITLEEGQNTTLIATISPNDADNKTVNWSSDKTNIASVDNTGKVTAIAEGSATIKAAIGEFSATCTVKVSKIEIAVTEVTLSKTSLELVEGDEVTLTATVHPSNATDKTVTWSTSNTNVATIVDGTVTAVSVGTATITAEAGDKSATCTVTVVSKGPEAVDLGLPSGIKWASYNIGATKPEEYGDYFAWGETEPKYNYGWSTYKWCNGTENTFTKYNTNSSYGTVDNKTLLEQSDDAARANLGGKWRMPTSAEFDELYKNCLWTWTTQGGKNGYKVTSNKNGNSIFLPVAGMRWGTSKEYMDNEGYYWSSSLGTNNPHSAQSLRLSNGYYYLMNYARKYGISVRPVYGDLFLVSSVSLSQTSLMLEVGNTTTLTVTVKPDNATDKTVSWISSNTSVATVSEGMVTAIADGTATITAVAGDKSATCTVTVTVPVSSIYLNPTTLTLEVGKTYSLMATVYPSNATDKTVSWTSSNTSVATVSKGTVTAVSVGTATITAEAGDKSATCVVTVASSVPKAVDLGLSVRWASYNIGATKPEEYGDYFAWGETEPKDNYDWSTYKWCNGTENTFTKYNTSSSYGTVDKITRLEQSDDAARANWGGNWRMPTQNEFQELMSNCTCSQTTINGVKGYLLTSKRTGNSIFLPTAGGRKGTSVADAGSTFVYWASTLVMYESSPTYEAYDPRYGASLHIYYATSYTLMGSYARYLGFPIRPVAQ